MQIGAGSAEPARGCQPANRFTPKGRGVRARIPATALLAADRAGRLYPAALAASEARLERARRARAVSSRRRRR